MIVYTSNPDQLALLDSIADDFIEQHSQVSSVAFESIAAADLDTRLTTELGTSEAPDASWMTVINSRRYMEAGALVDLAPTLREADGFDFEDLIPALQEPWADGDALYGVPFSTSPQVLYYNADMFREAGVPNPDEMIEAGDWTWESYRQAAAAVSESIGVPAYTPSFESIEGMYSLMYAFQASPWDEDAQTCTADSPAMHEAMSMLHGMMYEDGSTTIPGQSATVFDGSAAASIAYLSSVATLADATFEWGVVPTPAGPNSAQPAIGQSAFVAFESGATPDLAAQLVAHITNATNAAELAAHWVPSRESLLTAETLHESQPLLSVEQFEPIVEGVTSSGTLLPVSNNGGAAQSALLDALNEHLFHPDVDVAEALSAVCADLQPALESR